VACEALEVIGRVARQRDLEAAERAFARAADLAGAHGLRLWQLRALHELGTIDQLRTESVARWVARSRPDWVRAPMPRPLPASHHAGMTIDQAHQAGGVTAVLERPGARLVYEVAGDGPAVVLRPGAGCRGRT
jgi:hypothetical protein